MAPELASRRSASSMSKPTGRGRDGLRDEGELGDNDALGNGRNDHAEVTGTRPDREQNPRRRST